MHKHTTHNGDSAIPLADFVSEQVATQAKQFGHIVSLSYRPSDALCFDIDPTTGHLTISFAARALDAMPHMFSDEMTAWAAKHFPAGSQRDLLGRTCDYFVQLTKREVLMQIMGASEVEPD